MPTDTDTPRPPRSTWADLTDEQLLAQCDVDTYRASGPGGQKRNKTSSAVRIRHRPTALLVIAEESRSQHDNRAKALTRLRRAFHLDLRDALPEPLTPEAVALLPAWSAAPRPGGRVVLSTRDARFWPAAGVALDVLAAVQARVAEAAAALGLSTGQLVDFLQADPRLWQAANEARAAAGQKPLR